MPFPTKKVKTVKLYTNTKGFYFNYGNRRIYLHNVIRSDSNEYIGVYSLSNTACLVITNVDDVEDKVSYYVSII